MRSFVFASASFGYHVGSLGHPATLPGLSQVQVPVQPWPASALAHLGSLVQQRIPDACRRLRRQARAEQAQEPVCMGRAIPARTVSSRAACKLP